MKMKSKDTTKLKLVVDVKGRDALPVRALCFVAGRKRLSPDVVAGAACGVDHYSGKGYLPTYQLVDGVVHSVDPTQWVLFCEAIESASLLLREKGPSPRATRTQWFNEATMLLPGGVFVWLDEFQDWFRRTRPYRMEVGAAGFRLEQPEEGKLSLMPPIADGLKGCLLEGFPSASELPAALTPEAPAHDDVELVPGQIGPAVSSETPEPKGRQRRDDIQIEIDDVVVTKLISEGMPATEENIMGLLRQRAGRPDSCVNTTTPDGVVWTARSTGKTKELTRRVLHKRMCR
jgi:hypothetical protein